MFSFSTEDPKADFLMCRLPKLVYNVLLVMASWLIYSRAAAFVSTDKILVSQTYFKNEVMCVERESVSSLNQLLMFKCSETPRTAAGSYMVTWLSWAE